MPKDKIKIGSSWVGYDNDPTMEDLLKTLDAYNFRPTMTVTGELDRSNPGRYYPESNRLQIAPEGGTFNTMSHELTHATDESMDRKKADWTAPGYKTISQEMQFLDALTKLGDPTKLKRKWKGEPYMDDPYERRAFGVANMTPGKPMNPENPHVDATAAQEHAILRDLFRRAKR